MDCKLLLVRVFVTDGGPTDFRDPDGNVLTLVGPPRERASWGRRDR
jgi:hypothetical protein